MFSLSTYLRVGGAFHSTYCRGNVCGRWTRRSAGLPGISPVPGDSVRRSSRLPKTPICQGIIYRYIINMIYVPRLSVWYPKEAYIKPATPRGTERSVPAGSRPRSPMAGPAWRRLSQSPRWATLRGNESFVSATQPTVYANREPNMIPFSCQPNQGCNQEERDPIQE